MTGSGTEPTRSAADEGAGAEWNVIVTLAEPTFWEARRAFARWGHLRRTHYHNVLVMKVVDTRMFLQELAAAVEEMPGILNDFSHVIPLEQVVEFADAADLEKKTGEIALSWLPRLAGKSFHVRLHRRGLKQAVHTPGEERFLDDLLLDALAKAGTPGRISFDDPDAVLLIETIAHLAGLALWTREDLRRWPYLGVD